MEKECCQINVTKKDDGFILDITSKNIEEMCSCFQGKFTCCDESEKKEEDDS